MDLLDLVIVQSSLTLSQRLFSEKLSKIDDMLW